MELLIQALRFAIFVFMLVLFARVILSWVMVLSRDWRPTGVVLVLTEGVFTVTDPPVRAVRKIVPPLTIGGMRLDLGVLILFIALSLLNMFLGVLVFSM